MYRKLLATTALSLLLAGGAAAQDMPFTPAPAETPIAEPAAPALVTPADRGINADGWLASEILGTTIYTSAADDADAIGNINDIVVDANGSLAAVIVGVGGFLGLGEKNVALNWDDLDLTLDMNGNQRVVSNMTREQLEAAAEFNRAEWLATESGVLAPAATPADGVVITEPAPNAMDPAPLAPASDAMTPVAPAPDAMTPVAPAPDAMTPVAPAPGAMVPAEDPVVDGVVVTDSADLVPVTANEISADALTGTTVRGLDNEDIGAINDILLTQDGGVEAVIIDFGGFLGIGTKPVAVAYQNLEFFRDGDDNLVLRTALTREALEAAPEYDAETYAAAPNAQLLTLQ